MEKTKKKLSTPRKVVIIVCSVILAIAIAGIIFYIVQMNRANEIYSDAVEMYVIPTEDEDTDDEFRIDWDALWAVNPYVCGWIQIPAIPIIDYPIVGYTDNDYYLRRAWSGEYLVAGCIMLDYHCTNNFSDLHNILYGHNMTTGSMAGTMFGQLKQFQDQSFYDDNDDRIIIYTPERTLYYDIFSIHVIYPTTPGYYLVNFDRNDEYSEFIDRLNNATEVTTGITATEKDNILTLSTCSGTGSTKRLLVHGVLTKSILPDGSYENLDEFRNTIERPEITTGIEGYEEPEPELEDGEVIWESNNNADTSLNENNHVDNEDNAYGHNDFDDNPDTVEGTNTIED